jgi:phosphopantetheinyl transferase
MISVLAASVPVQPPKDWKAPVVSLERSRQIARKHHAVDRLRSQIADALLLELLSSGSSTPHRYGASGQPLAPDPGVHLSASHDGRWVVAASATQSIGIDVVDSTRINPDRFHDHLHPDEYDVIRSCTTSSERIRHLAICWAAKEAYTKREGVGLTIDPRQLRLEYLGNSRGVLWHDVVPAPVEIRQIDRDHLLAVVSEKHSRLRLLSVASAPNP